MASNDTPQPSAALISDNAARSQFEATIDGATAFLTYERTPHTFTIVHTEVPSELRGHHLGGRLIEAALAKAHADNLQVIVICPFARSYLRARASSA